jgi:hypothetical protein
MKSLEMITRGLSISQDSKGIQNAAFVGNDFMETMNCTHIAGKSMKSVTSVTEGTMADIRSIT